eukprot:CAMPEP_0181075432 /NCGR_PEP_ID=MMETSP1070-20121207/30104_1 /TAXON_ID=265543 /ORGANISM="Minutocellus polymorphus, Strain NH13" /LENGTH=403 /DNA_ID=CAMNT_0023156559 /DNA_START=132 /DNA_END=1344 /DNA_ORIENTATION=+
MKAASAGGGVGGGTSNEPELKRRRLLDAGGPIEDDETARRKMRDAEVYERGVDGDFRVYAGFDPNPSIPRKINKGHPLYRRPVQLFHWSGRRSLSLYSIIYFLVSPFLIIQSAVSHDGDAYDSHIIKPMGHFAREGDLPMMRWLYVNGADTRDEEVLFWFPLYSAVRFGTLEVCKWLFAHGAAGDIKRTVADTRYTPLSGIFDESDKRTLSRWLILNGALCKDDDTGELDHDLITKDLTYHGDDSARELPELLMWAREHHQCRSAFGVFLMGTLSILEYSNTKLRHAFLARIRSEKVVDRILRNTPPDQYRLLWDELFPQRVCCSLAALCGKSGILELIGDYVGIMRGREARIIRQLTDLLPGVIAELDAKRAQSNLEADSNDDSDDDNDGSDGSDDFYESDA